MKPWARVAVAMLPLAFVGAKCTPPSPPVPHVTVTPSVSSSGASVNVVGGGITKAEHPAVYECLPAVGAVPTAESFDRYCMLYDALPVDGDAFDVWFIVYDTLDVGLTGPRTCGSCLEEACMIVVGGITADGKFSGATSPITMVETGPPIHLTIYYAGPPSCVVYLDGGDPHTITIEYANGHRTVIDDPDRLLPVSAGDARVIGGNVTAVYYDNHRYPIDIGPECGGAPGDT